MSAAELMVDLGRLGIRLQTDGCRLRYFPRSALTPDLLDRLKAHKVDLLRLLRQESEQPQASPMADEVWATFPKPVCRCGSLTWRDIRIHDGQSVRRDCGSCERFLEFTVWYGKTLSLMNSNG